MRRHVSAAIFVLATAFAAVSAQQGPAAPQVPSVSKRPNGGGLATIRMGAPDNTMWFGWRVSAPMASLKGMTFSDALAKADVWPVASVEASSTQITSFEVPKPLDQRLQTNERAAVVYRLREIAESIAAYRVDNIGADAAARRRRVRVRQGDQRAAHHHERGCGESGRARQAGRGVRHRRRAREQGRSEDRDGGARRARQTHGRERPSGWLGAGWRQSGRWAGYRQGQAAARHRC